MTGRLCLPTDPNVFLRTVPGFSRGKASGSKSSYHVAVVPVIGRLFSSGGLRSAASSSRIWTGEANKVSGMFSYVVSILKWS